MQFYNSWVYKPLYSQAEIGFFGGISLKASVNQWVNQFDFTKYIIDDLFWLNRIYVLQIEWMSK